VIDTKTVFNAVDGLHHASINDGIVSLQMIDVTEIYSTKLYFLEYRLPSSLN
jgi:diaminopimelate epimerase